MKLRSRQLKEVVPGFLGDWASFRQDQPTIHNHKHPSMAHLPTLPDPSKQRSPHGQTGPLKPSDTQFSFSELTKLLGQHGAGSSSEDLALDLLLHEVASQACSSTNATSAAIALSRDGEFVCRATTGKHAPDLGSHLSSDSGLSGACIQSCEVQRCDDTETDSRVDAAACRLLGVRSIIVVPLLKRNEVIGILETFSPRPHAFTDSDAQTLLLLSRRTMDTMMASAEKEEITPAVTLFNDNETVSLPGKDPWTLVLTVLVVALALLLGWMLGHRTSGKASEGVKIPSTAFTSAKATLPSNKIPSATTPASSTAITGTAATIPKTSIETPGGLVVYENGKLVFQVKPVPSSARSETVQVPPSAANSLLIERVEPQYPEPARLGHVQGAVVLEVNVDETGTVQELRALSGDPQLVMAAAEAVRQWRFKPYAPRGQALNFVTQVSVDFKLP